MKFIHEVSLSFTDLEFLKEVTHENKKDVDLSQVTVCFHSNYVPK